MKFFEIIIVLFIDLLANISDFLNITPRNRFDNKGHWAGTYCMPNICIRENPTSATRVLAVRRQRDWHGSAVNHNHAHVKDSFGRSHLGCCTGVR